MTECCFNAALSLLLSDPPGLKSKIIKHSPRNPIFFCDYRLVLRSLHHRHRQIIVLQKPDDHSILQLQPVSSNGMVRGDHGLRQVHSDQTSSLSSPHSRSVQPRTHVFLCFTAQKFFYLFQLTYKKRMRLQFRCLIFGAGLIVTSALIIWKGLICMTGSESPVVVVLSESMEPGFARVSSIPF